MGRSIGVAPKIAARASRVQEFGSGRMDLRVLSRFTNSVNGGAHKKSYTSRAYRATENENSASDGEG